MVTRIRKRVADLLNTEHRVSQTKLHGLSVKDRTQLDAIAAGERSPVYRVKALAALAATRDPAAAESFRGALDDAAADFTVRAAGATWLARQGGMAAEGALIERLAVEEMPVVQHKIVSGLTRVGSEASLRRLADAVQSRDPAVRDHARFAQAVIACRTGTAGFELPPPDPSLRLPAPAAAETSSAASDTRPEDAVRMLEQTVGDSFGVSGDPEGVVALRCGRRNLSVVIDAPVRRGAADRLARPAVAGFVAMQAEADASFATALLVLTWPNSRGGVDVSVNRLSGRTMYVGEGQLDGDTVRFRLDAVQAPGATETTVTGTLTGGRLSELNVAAGRTLERSRPTPMEDR